jgi:hypothetical protein
MVAKLKACARWSTRVRVYRSAQTPLGPLSDASQDPSQIPLEPLSDPSQTPLGPLLDPSQTPLGPSQTPFGPLSDPFQTLSDPSRTPHLAQVESTQIEGFVDHGERWRQKLDYILHAHTHAYTLCLIQTLYNTALHLYTRTLTHAQSIHRSLSLFLSFSLSVQFVWALRMSLCLIFVIRVIRAIKVIMVTDYSGYSDC